MKDYSIFLEKHPEAKVFMGLAEDLEKVGIPIYFNAGQDYNLDELEALAKEESCSIWDDFDLLIETQTGELIDEQYAPVSAEFDGKNFLVNDRVSGKKYMNPTREDAFQVFKDYMDSRSGK